MTWRLFSVTGRHGRQHRLQRLLGARSRHAGAGTGGAGEGVQRRLSEGEWGRVSAQHTTRGLQKKVLCVVLVTFAIVVLIFVLLVAVGTSICTIPIVGGFFDHC